MKIDAKNVTLKNGVTVILRSAKPSDAEALLGHLIITHTESYKNLNQSVAHWESVSVQTEEKILEDFESSAAKFMLIALHGEKIVGGLGLFGFGAEFVRKTASLGMSVQQAYANTGLGTALLEYALSCAHQAGFHRLELTVRTYNHAGIALYEKVGFERIGRLKDAAFIDGSFADEFSYQKILS